LIPHEGTHLMKLTKTQTALLLEANRHCMGVVATYFGHVTSRKAGCFGGRGSDAAQTLRDSGLFVFLRSHHSIDQLCHRMGAMHCTETVWQITEAGKALAISLKPKA
jgi:hypothetical protein